VSQSLQAIGIIAGSRSLHLLFARQARALGVSRIVAVAFEGETSAEIEQWADDVVWVKVGQLNKMIAAFTERQIRQCVMLGQIAPRHLFDVRPDLRAVALLLRLKEKNAQTLFAALADELRKDGVELIEATPWLRPLMPGTGLSLGRKLTAAQWEDVAFGFRIAKEIARLEIGQSVVVKNGTVLAVEGFEGTDKCLSRGGELAGKGGGAVAVKVAKEKHDMRFDVPCIGPQTIETCGAARLAVLAVEAGRTLFLEEEEMIALARRHDLAVVTTDGSV
jgi:UDP-2,3-diacylglucosamine hydrolase